MRQQQHRVLGRDSLTGPASFAPYPGGPTCWSDGGRRWQQSSVRLVISADSLAVPLLSFTDANHGWLVLGNVTWHTADGGGTWTRG